MARKMKTMDGNHAAAHASYSVLFRPKLFYRKKNAAENRRILNILII